MRERVIRKHLIFYGKVQGVGFRYHACHAAEYFGMTGWVRNCYDGSVEAEIQGLPEEIDRWIIMLKEGRFIDIEDIEEKTTQVKEESGFKICS